MRGFDEVIVDRDDRVVADARLRVGQKTSPSSDRQPWIQNCREIFGELVRVGHEPDDDVVHAVEQDREHRARVTFRIFGSGCCGASRSTSGANASRSSSECARSDGRAHERARPA